VIVIDPASGRLTGATAVGAGEAPTLIYGWGGGILKGYVDAGQVVDLTSWVNEDSAWKQSFVASTWGAGTIDGKIYAVPTNNTQPVVMYYNTKLFEQAGAELPKTWDDVLHLTEVFNSKGIAPISLGGGSNWTSMMWLEYLFDRVGGPEVFTNIFNGKADAWAERHPDTITVIHQENKGHGGAVMAGLRAATGVYFKVVDSDDWLDPVALNLMLSKLRHFIHSGSPLPLVYDMADLYKEELCVDLAFKLTRDMAGRYDKQKVAASFRQRVSDMDLLEKISNDIASLLESGRAHRYRK